MKSDSHPREPLLRLSITGKLTLLYTLSMVCILSVTAVFLYWTLVNNLDREDEGFLSTKIRVLRTILRERPDRTEALEEEVKWEGLAYQSPTYFARVLDDRGNTLIESPGAAASELQPRLFPPPVEGFEAEGTERPVQTPSGRHFLLMSAWARVGKSGDECRLLQVALDVSQEVDIVTGYRRTFAGMLLGGVLFAILTGLVIARRGMRPIEEITRAARHITSARLGERIDPARWPRELTDLAAAFDSMLDRLEDSFTRLSRFTADVAHELRTPINNLRGETEVALSRARGAEEYRRVLESNLEEYERLSRITESLLFLARAERKEIRLERTRFDPRKEIESVLEFFSAVAEERSIRVACEGRAELYADPMLFRRAVSNLIANALQYTPPGGEVFVSVAQAEDRAVVVRVENTGPGIAPEDLPRVFDRFYRADEARSRQPQGIGLGLTIVRSIMEFHGGSVSIRSEPGRGVTVSLRFPLEP